MAQCEPVVLTQAAAALLSLSKSPHHSGPALLRQCSKQLWTFYGQRAASSRLSSKQIWNRSPGRVSAHVCQAAA